MPLQHIGSGSAPAAVAHNIGQQLKHLHKPPAKKKGPKKVSGHKHSSGSHGGHGAHSQGHSGKGGHGGSSHAKKHTGMTHAPSYLVNPQVAAAYAASYQPVYGSHQNWDHSFADQLASSGTRSGQNKHGNAARPKGYITGFGRRGRPTHSGDGNPMDAGLTDASQKSTLQALGVLPHGSGSRGGRGRGRGRSGHPGHHGGASHGGNHHALSAAVGTAGSMSMRAGGDHVPATPLHLPPPVRLHIANHHH